MWSLGLLNAGAAEFGPQQVRSGPGQPLRAVIVLGNVSQAEADGLSVKLAPRDAFKQAGLRYDPTLDKLSVSVTPTGGRDAGYSGTYLVHVDSVEPVSTSFLDLLLVLEWRTGRQSNAVTLSAIPEASAAQPQAVVPAAAANSAAGADASASTSRSATPAPAAAAPAGNGAENRVGASGENTRTVTRGDSLSSIAREYTGGEGGTTLAQMMTALFESNRSAFVGNDPNRLRQGATLSRPADAQVQSIPPAQARKFVSAAREQFDAYRARLADSTAQQAAPAGGRSAQGAIEAGKAPEAATPATRDELKLSRPGKGGTAGRAGGNEEEQIAQGKAQAEAQGRVNELQKNVADLQKLLAMKNQAVANLEQQAATASGASAQEKTAKSADGKTTAPAAAGTQTATNAAANADAKPADTAASNATAAAASGAAANDAASAASADANASEATAVAASASDAAAASAAAASAPVAESKPTPNAAMNWRALTQNPYVLPGAGALVVLLGLWWLMRRRRAEPPVGQPGPYDDGRDGQGGDVESSSLQDKPHAAEALEPTSHGVATAAGVAAAGAAGAAALYAANQAEADEHLHPEADATWTEPGTDAAAHDEAALDSTAAASNELDAWDAEQAPVTDELAETAHAEGLGELQDAAHAEQAASEAFDTPAEPVVDEAPTHEPAPVAEAASEPEIDWDAAFAEEAGQTSAPQDSHDAHADDALTSLEALGAAAVTGGVAVETLPHAAPEGGVAGMLGDLDLGIPGQPANVGTISSDALPSLSKGIGSVQFTMAPSGDPRLEAAHTADSGDMTDMADLDDELSDADFDAAMQQAASATEAPRSYTDAAHEAPSLRPMSFDLSDFSLDLKGDDAQPAATPAFVSAPTLPDVTGEEALVEHETLEASAPQTPYAEVPAAPQHQAGAPEALAHAPEAIVPHPVETAPSAAAVAPAAAAAVEPGVPDEFHTKLELATAYQTIGDDDGARELLEEVIAGGDAAQQSIARSRLAELGK
ncbi:FimV/HubP family polar landmark protein [Pandoraea sputorum]|uniref:Peptidoglycan-binding LysM n=1 Tax=Pandoraea sputorum TaxID=93222 RepID=A0A5E5BB81_9BURK|nr:FimV/HubP family polar landmark protein [Pandoraea sputorum]VVE81903.1 peptidoglycan-binding LysM [Pandoraea sputorum]